LAAIALDHQSHARRDEAWSGRLVAGSARIAACVAPGFGTEVGSAGTGAFAEAVADEERQLDLIAAIWSWLGCCAAA
jgi:hypothetical protein